MMAMKKFNDMPQNLQSALAGSEMRGMDKGALVQAIGCGLINERYIKVEKHVSL